MRYGQLFALLDQAKLSPEQAAKRLGVSNMSLRRWKGRAGAVPEKYVRAFAPALEMMAAEGLLDANALAAVLPGRGEEDFKATLLRLGFPEDILSADPGDRGALVDGLSHIGADVERKDLVDRTKKEISLFSRFGTEWKERIAAMLKVINSKELLAVDKLVAYGALFYLITPFDLIPDTIPVIGYLDDFAILGIALWFYRKRFPKLMGTKRPSQSY